MLEGSIKLSRNTEVLVPVQEAEREDEGDPGKEQESSAEGAAKAGGGADLGDPHDAVKLESKRMSIPEAEKNVWS